MRIVDLECGILCRVKRYRDRCGKGNKDLDHMKGSPLWP